MDICSLFLSGINRCFSRFKMVELCNKALEIATALKINTTNIGGVDLVNGDIRPTMGTTTITHIDFILIFIL